MTNVDKLKKLAYKDNLTGLWNRNAFDETVKKVKPAYFGVIDIDHFKKINDTYGHDVGDEVLKTIAKYLDKNLLTYRWGGEEFVILIPEKDNVENYLNMVKEEISKIKIPNIEGNITVSIGYTEYDKNKKIDDIFKEADKALYCAKDWGRNRVVKYEEGMDCEAHSDTDGTLIKNESCQKCNNVVSNRKKEIAIDLDGTIARHEGRYDIIGEPIKENVEIIRRLKEKGYSIIIFSARISYDKKAYKMIKDYLDKYNIPYDEITNIKPYSSIAFIDDRGIGVETNKPWPADIEKKIEEIIERGKIKSSDLKDELVKKLNIDSETIEQVLKLMEDNKINIPVLKLAYPEIKFDSDLLKKIMQEKKGI